jgi:hypothetical protein
MVFRSKQRAAGCRAQRKCRSRAGLAVRSRTVVARREGVRPIGGLTFGIEIDQLLTAS